MERELNASSIECNGFFYNETKKDQAGTKLNKEVTRICHKSFGDQKEKATDSPHALKIPIVFKVTKCAKQKQCEVSVAGWGMFKDWRSKKQQESDKIAKKYASLCYKYGKPFLDQLAELQKWNIPKSREEKIQRDKRQVKMCWNFRNAGWDSIVRDTIAKFRFQIARKA